MTRLTGYTSDLGDSIKYTFTWDDDYLVLVPCDSKAYDHIVGLFTEDIINKDLLQCTDENGRRVYFLRCELIKGNGSYSCRPAGCIILKKLLKGQYSQSFQTITFYGEAITYFFWPTHIVKKADFSSEDGSGSIELKGFTDITHKYHVTICNKPAVFTISISYPGEPTSISKDWNLEIGRAHV